MSLKKTLLFSLTTYFIIFNSCINNDNTCDIDPGLIDCIAFPTLGFLISSNGENIFNSNTKTLESISITGADAQNTELALRSGFDSVDGPVLFITDSDWKSGDYEYLIELDTNDSFSINSSFELSEGPCCGGIPILDNILIDNAQAERHDTTGFFLVTLN